MYKLEYLPVAQRDMVEIVRYISGELQNFLMFYWVDEEKKLVTVARVVYAKRDVAKLLE